MLSKKQRKRIAKASRNKKNKEERASKRKSKNQRDWTKTKRAKGDDEQQPNFVFERGLRLLKPYVYCYETYAKQRWYGRSMLEVCNAEYGGFLDGYFEAAISQGLITVNGEETDPSREIRNGDFIAHHTLRQEPPVSDHVIFYHSTSHFPGVIVINKPATIPIHACGPYRHNSVLGILKSEAHLTGLHTIHRIDRLTSGLVLLADNAQTARSLGDQILSKTVRKVYIALVGGKLVASDGCDGTSEDAATISLPGVSLQNGKFHVDRAICVVSHKHGSRRCANESDEGQEASTTVIPLKYCPQRNVTLVKCLPYTGRTHQIRVHLQYLGHPIVNDPLYSLDDSNAQEMRHQMTLTRFHFVLSPPPLLNGVVLGQTVRNNDDKHKSEAEAQLVPTTTEAPEARHLKALREVHTKFPPIFNEAQTNCPGLCLHSWRYMACDNSWSFEAGLPEWASSIMNSPTGSSKQVGVHGK